MQYNEQTREEINLDSYNRDELWTRLSQLGTTYKYTVNVNNVRQDKLQELAQYTQLHLVKLTKAFRSASNQVSVRTPFSLPFRDVVKDEGTIIFDVGKFTVEEDNKIKEYPVNKGAIQWSQKHIPLYATLAVEVANDVNVTRDTISQAPEVKVLMFKPMENAAQRSASEVCLTAIKDAGLINQRNMTPYEVADEVYKAAEKSHPHTVMKFLDDIVVEDPDNIKTKMTYATTPGHNAPFKAPGSKIATKQAFSRPPVIRSKLGGSIVLSKAVSTKYLHNLHQHFGSVIGNKRNRGGFHTSFLVGAPLATEVAWSLSILQNVRSLNLEEKDLLVFDSGNESMIAMIAHNLGRPMACMGPNMTVTERRSAWAKKSVITYKDQINLRFQITEEGKEPFTPRLIFYNTSYHQLVIGSNYDLMVEKGAKEFSRITSGEDTRFENGDVSIYFARPHAMGLKTMSTDKHFFVEYDGGTPVKFYVGINHDQSSGCVMFTTDEDLLSQNISCEQASSLTALYMFNYMYYRWHRKVFYSVLCDVQETRGNIYSNLDFSMFRMIRCMVLPKTKVKVGFDMNYMSASAVDVLMEYDVGRYEAMRDEAILRKGGEDEENVNDEPPDEEVKEDEVEEGDTNELGGLVADFDENEDGDVGQVENR